MALRIAPPCAGPWLRRAASLLVAMTSSLPGVVRTHARERPRAPALVVWSGEHERTLTISYAELATYVSLARRRVAGLLQPGSPTVGQRVALLAHNSPAYLVHSLAIMDLGAMAIHLKIGRAHV